jgi:hypothetical protein
LAVDTGVVHRELIVERGESPAARWEMTNGAPGLGLGGMVEAYCGDRNLVAAWSRLERRRGNLAIGELIADTGRLPAARQLGTSPPSLPTCLARALARRLTG